MTCTRLHWKTHALDRSVLEHILVVHDNLIHLPFDLSAGGAGQSPVEGLLALAEERRKPHPCGRSSAPLFAAFSDQSPPVLTAVRLPDGVSAKALVAGVACRLLWLFMKVVGVEVRLGWFWLINEVGVAFMLEESGE